MTITPDQIIPSGFIDNLGTDFIAVNAQGTITGRAATKEAVERANPDATYFTGADLAGKTKAPTLAEAALGSTDAALAAVVAQGIAENQPVPAVEKTHEDVIDPTGFGPPSVVDATPAADDEPVHPAAVDTEALTAEEPTPVADGSAFDHDGDGKAGGSKSRQRKPSK